MPETPSVPNYGANITVSDACRVSVLEHQPHREVGAIRDLSEANNFIGGSVVRRHFTPHGDHIRAKLCKRISILDNKETQTLVSGEGSGEKDEILRKILRKPSSLPSLPSDRAVIIGSGDSICDSSRKFPVHTVLYEMLTGKAINILLIFLPLAYASHVLEWKPTYVFWLNFLAMVPLASLLGDFTEELAMHTNQTIGGLINASFGNAVEVVVSIQALLANEIRVVQASLIGSVFSNLLLVQGFCFFCGGMKFKQQKFNPIAASANLSLLLLSSLALILPTPFASYADLENEDVLLVSRIAAVFLLCMYIQLLIFQLVTHKDLFDEESDEKPALSFFAAAVGLISMTLLVTVFSEFLVASIDGFVNECGISKTFVGVVILPIVGNAVEHITAVSMAMKNKMDLAMGIAIGSSTQIAMFVVPATVLIGWSYGIDMTLNFPMYEVSLYLLSILISIHSTTSGTTNWLGGSLLIFTYFMIAAGFYFEKLDVQE
mmetsp:Transcript_40400/g.79051  ORF Transcript_40400/g.79051 Transcript_40400/m.79051 type:complete len:490 (+) Transcript_40400:140-1609(+)